MPIRIGTIEALFRYPVKSMRGEALDASEVDWHGLVGDRRLALRRLDERGGFPWLSASRLPELVLFAPLPTPATDTSGVPPLIRTPGGELLATFGPELAAEVGRRLGSPVEMMHLRQGVFDEASISVISSATVEEIARLAERAPDLRRFRPNIVVRPLGAAAFEEEQWVGGTLSFGAGGDAATIAVTLRDERCAMVNLDPDSAERDPRMLKAIVGARGNKVGVYGAVTRLGRLAVGQPVFFEPRTVDGGSA